MGTAATDKSIAIPVESLDKLLGHGDGNAALLYLHVLRCGGFSVERAARALKCTEAELTAAAGYTNTEIMKCTMIATYNRKHGAPLTPEQIERLEELKNYPIVFDENCPEMTGEQPARFKPVHPLHLKEQGSA